MLRYWITCVFLTIGLTCPGQKSANTNKPLTLFSINNTQVNTDEFVYLYRKNYAARPEEFTEAKINEYLDLYIKFKLKVMEAKARGMDTTAAFRKEFNSYKEELKKPYLATDAEMDRLVKEAYDHLREEIRVSHILIMVRPDATPEDTLKAFNKLASIRSKAIAGEDFGKLAAEYSEDPGARTTNGDLGYFTGFQFVYPFERAAYSTPAGKISQIVRTRFGYHLIKVHDRRPARGEVEVSHIYRSGRDGKEAEAKNILFDVVSQLQAGRKWEELCAEFSEDAATKDTGGRLRPFGVRGMDIPEFEKMAFSLLQEGQVSDPFQSPLGWHLIRLEKKIPVPSFKELEPSLKKRVSRDDRFNISKAETLKRRKTEFGFQEGEAINSLLKHADSTLTKGKWTFSPEAGLAQQSVFFLKNTSVSAGEFVRYVKQNQGPSSLAPKTYLLQLLDGFTDEKIVELEDEQLMDQHPELRRLLQEYREGILLFSIMEKEVWTKASEDSAGQHAFYNQNLAKYKTGDRIEARIFSTADKAFFEEAKNKIHRGDSLTVADLKKFKSVQNFRAYEKGENKTVDKISWSIGLHESETDGIYYLVEVKGLIPPGTKDFQEARAQVISDYQDFLEKKWLEKLQQKYVVKVNPKGKKQVMTELSKK